MRVECSIKRCYIRLRPGYSPGPTMKRDFPIEHVTLHGSTVGYRMAGNGPLIVLLHGITSTSDAWLDVMAPLAERYTVVAPDLLGHGRSAKPRGDYSLGAYASGCRDLLGALGYERGTIVGHSLGGGIALQFAYQFPEYCERLALVSSGGLGKEVHPLLRAAALPGSELVLPLVTPDWALRAGASLAGALERVGFKAGPDLAEAARGYASLAERGAREAFVHTLRAVIDREGQRVSATDRLYLAQDLPTLLIWGTADPIIPAQHGRDARDLIPGSRLVEIPGAGHWPQLDDPDGFAFELTRFVETTEPYSFDVDHMREMLRRGPPGAPAIADQQPA
jgi:pimeloyl-ACP methyl ester carboxylesterase